jgi:NAD(P)H-quinone oxidoreductase subunit 5
VAFVAAYLAIESGVYQHSQRLYVALLNAGQPPSDTLLTATEEYDEY